MTSGELSLATPHLKVRAKWSGWNLLRVHRAQGRLGGWALLGDECSGLEEEWCGRFGLALGFKGRTALMLTLCKEKLRSKRAGLDRYLLSVLLTNWARNLNVARAWKLLEFLSRKVVYCSLKDDLNSAGRLLIMLSVRC